MNRLYLAALSVRFYQKHSFYLVLYFLFSLFSIVTFYTSLQIHWQLYPKADLSWRHFDQLLQADSLTFCYLGLWFVSLCWFSLATYYLLATFFRKQQTEIQAFKQFGFSKRWLFGHFYTQFLLIYLISLLILTCLLIFLQYRYLETLVAVNHWIAHHFFPQNEANWLNGLPTEPLTVTINQQTDDPVIYLLASNSYFLSFTRLVKIWGAQALLGILLTFPTINCLTKRFYHAKS